MSREISEGKEKELLLNLVGDTLQWQRCSTEGFPQK